MHTAVRWLSRRKVFVRVFEMRQEIYIFLEEFIMPVVTSYVCEQGFSSMLYVKNKYTWLNSIFSDFFNQNFV